MASADNLAQIGIAADSETCQLIGQETWAGPSWWVPAARHTRTWVEIGLGCVALQTGCIEEVWECFGNPAAAEVVDVVVEGAGSSGVRQSWP